MEEDYEFEYEDDDQEELDIELENKYYNAKGLKEEDPVQAVQDLQLVLACETEPGEWGFRALKQSVKISFRIGYFEWALRYYERLLPYVDSYVNKNYSEKSINNLLEYVSSCSNRDFLQKFYQLTLTTIRQDTHQKLWIKTQLKAASILLENNEFAKLTKLLKTLHAYADQERRPENHIKATQLLELYALEIQLYTLTKNNKKLKDIYHKCSQVKSAIPHPRILGIIKECGGKMFMREENWKKAQTDFFDSFKNYDEAGNARRIQVLKYLVLASMLSESQVNPFDSQETVAYKNNPDIIAMTNLVEAFQAKRIHQFECILRDNHHSIMGDAFIKTYIDQVLRTIRTQVITDFVLPFSQIDISYISEQLNVPLHDVEDLLTFLIHESKINGKIDKVNRVYKSGRSPEKNSRYQTLQTYAEEVNGLFVNSLEEVTEST